MAELRQNDLKDKYLSENFSLVQAFGEYIVNQMQEGDDKSVFLVYTEGEKTACVVGGKRNMNTPYHDTILKLMSENMNEVKRLNTTRAV